MQNKYLVTFRPNDFMLSYTPRLLLAPYLTGLLHLELTDSLICLGISSFDPASGVVHFCPYLSSTSRPMANQTRYYFLAPTWDFPPPLVGPIRLGNVIASLKTPERALFTPLSSTDLNAFSTEQHNVTFSTEKLRSGQVSILTRFLSFVLGVGIDASSGWEGR